MPSTLIHPTVALFRFALEMEKNRQKYHTLQDLKQHKCAIFFKCRDQIINSNDTQRMRDDATSCSRFRETSFRLFCMKYFNITANQFHKEAKDNLDYQKKLTHRAKHKGAVNNPTVTFDQIISGTENKKVTKHCRQQ